MLLLALSTAPQGLHGLALWHQGMSLDTPTFIGKRNQARHLSDDIGLFVVLLLLSLACLTIGFLARRARLKRDRETLHFDPIEE